MSGRRGHLTKTTGAHAVFQNSLSRDGMFTGNSASHYDPCVHVSSDACHAVLGLPPMLLPTSSAGLLGATSATTILVTPSSKISPKRRLACASFVSNVTLQGS